MKEGNYEYPEYDFAAAAIFPQDDDDSFLLLHRRCDKDSDIALSLFLDRSFSREPFGAHLERSWRGLAEEIRHRSSDDAATWEARWDGGGSCPNLDGRSYTFPYSYSPDARHLLIITGSDKEEDEEDRGEMVGGVGDGEELSAQSHKFPIQVTTITHSLTPQSLIHCTHMCPTLLFIHSCVSACPAPSTPSPTETARRFVHHQIFQLTCFHLTPKKPADHSHSSFFFQNYPPPSIRPYPSPLGFGRMAPHLNQADHEDVISASSPCSSSASEKSFELPPMLHVRSQPIPIRHTRQLVLQLNNDTIIQPASSPDSMYHSDVESAILEPRSPPQRDRQPSLSTLQINRTRFMSPDEDEDPRYSVNGRRKRAISTPPPALRSLSGVAVQGHPSNSDVSLFELGDSLVDVNERLGRLSLNTSAAVFHAGSRQRSHSMTRIGEESEEVEDQDSPLTSYYRFSNEKAAEAKGRIPLLRTDSNELMRSPTSASSSSQPSQGGSTPLFPIDEDLIEKETKERLTQLYRQQKQAESENVKANAVADGDTSGSEDEDEVAPLTMAACTTGRKSCT